MRFSTTASLIGMLFVSKSISAIAGNHLEYEDEDEDEYGNGFSSLDDYDEHGRRLTVIPPDNRVEYNPLQYQRGVGLLTYTVNGTEKNCTATLITREIALTDAECVAEDILATDGSVLSRAVTSEFQNSMSFNIGYAGGTPGPYTSGFKAAYVPKQYLNVAPKWPQFKFALIHLTDALGDATGFMRLSNKPIATYGVIGVNLVSFMYLGNTTASADYCCQIIGVIDGRVQHLCDTAYGSNGAPLYEQVARPHKPGKYDYELIALNNGEEPTYNLAAATRPIREALALFKIKRDAPYLGASLLDEANDPILCNNTVAPTKRPTHKPPTAHPTHPPTKHTHQPSTVIHNAPSSARPTPDPTPEPTTHAPTRKPTTHRPTPHPTTKPPTHKPTHKKTDEPTTCEPAMNPPTARLMLRA